ncbi:hypothetical protein Btru_036795 [Bulinus truncatus]|nr:hypothetical protein Btru_036795 [Bulinus truncatus]
MICEHRSKFGPFLTLEELKKVKGVGLGRFKEICEKFHSDPIISAPEKNIKSKSEKPLRSFFSPELKPELLKDISTATSVSVCADAVYFASLSKDLEVLNWNHIMLNDSESHKQSAPKILEQALTIVEKLPCSSVYLMETRSPRKMSLGYIQMLMFICQLQMALVTLLNRDLNLTHQHKVYHVSDTFSVKAFGLNVGGERVSGGHIIKLIEDNQYSDAVSIHPNLWKHFHGIENSLYKERYSNCLLLGLAFFQHFCNKNMFQ